MAAFKILRGGQRPANPWLWPIFRSPLVAFEWRDSFGGRRRPMLRPEVREALRSGSEDTAAPHAPEQSCSLGCGADDWSCLGIAPPDPDSADEEASRAPPAEFEKDIEWGAGGDDDTATATSVEEDEKLLESLPRAGRLRLAVEFRLEKKLLLRDVGEELRRRERCLLERAALLASLFPLP